MKRIFAFIAALFLAGSAFADPTVTLTASPDSGVSPLATTLTWSSTNCDTLTAGSTPGWNGIVPASGTRKLTGIAGTAKLTLVCDTGTPSATLSWDYTWLYTDGTGVKDPGGFELVSSTTQDMVTPLSTTIPDPTLRTFKIPLAVGTYYFALKAYTVGGLRSDLSNTVSKVVVAQQQVGTSVTITIVKMLKVPVLK